MRMLPVQKLSYLLNVLLLLLVIHLANRNQTRTQGDTDNYGVFQPSKVANEKRTSRGSNQSEAWDVSLVCMVLTTPSNFKLKAVHVAATWGRRCSKLVFLSDHGSGHVYSDSGATWEVLEIRGVKGREALWDKVNYNHLLKIRIILTLTSQRFFLPAQRLRILKNDITGEAWPC